MYTETGKLIKKHREAAGLTLEQAGRKMRPTRSRQQWHQWESGRSEPQLRILRNIAKVLGVTPGELLGD